MQEMLRRHIAGLAVVAAVVLLTNFGGAGQARAQLTAFKQAVAEAASADRAIADFYKDTGYEPLWTAADRQGAERRRALFRAMAGAALHGLPPARHDGDGLKAQLGDIRSPRARGLAEVAMSRAFLALAHDMRAGVLTPTEIDPGIRREVPHRTSTAYFETFLSGDPHAYFRTLAPATNEYARLRKEMLRLRGVLAEGGWGPAVPARVLKPGQSGRAVVALRDRLMAMGYLGRTASAAYDSQLEKAVAAFQRAHGLEEDGVAGSSTMAAINVPVETRLQQIIVAMERERWLPRDRGRRHVLVNLTDFSARIIDDGVVTFRTRAVVGRNAYDRRSPEFSDEMEHMIINPTWHVPRSIAVNEYLPQMQSNPNAASHLQLVDVSGRVVSRSGIDFSAYTRNTFPFDLKQPPSRRNALGLVKFMFPNRHNIYLHDTPAKHLFSRNKRDYSHGCIRLQQPFEFAYMLLSRQTEDPEGFFQRILNTGQETQVDLERHVPVHIVYRTAFTTPQGRAQFRNDVYGRDRKIWEALSRAGVSLNTVRG